MTTLSEELLTFLGTMDTMRRSCWRGEGEPPFETAEGYVLRNGHLAESAELTDEEWIIVREAMGRAVFPIKECFLNARKLSMRSNSRLKYVEGYALGAIIPVQHAWCEINGKVIDPTWRHFSQPKRKGPYKHLTMGLIPEDNIYMGVPFNIYIHKDWGSIIDDWEGGWPLLRVKREDASA